LPTWLKALCAFFQNILLLLQPFQHFMFWLNEFSLKHIAHMAP